MRAIKHQPKLTPFSIHQAVGQGTQNAFNPFLCTLFTPLLRASTNTITLIQNAHQKEHRDHTGCRPCSFLVCVLAHLGAVLHSVVVCLVVRSHWPPDRDSFRGNVSPDYFSQALQSCIYRKSLLCDSGFVCGHAEGDDARSEVIRAPAVSSLLIFCSRSSGCPAAVFGSGDVVDGWSVRKVGFAGGDVADDEQVLF